jgi:hypothetical protein
MKDILTVAETASFLKKHPDTIRNWIITKKLKARKISAGGKGVYVLLRTDVLEYIVTESYKKVNNETKKTRDIINPSSQVKLPI